MCACCGHEVEVGGSPTFTCNNDGVGCTRHGVQLHRDAKGAEVILSIATRFYRCVAPASSPTRPPAAPPDPGGSGPTGSTDDADVTTLQVDPAASLPSGGSQRRQPRSASKPAPVAGRGRHRRSAARADRLEGGEASSSSPARTNSASSVVTQPPTPHHQPPMPSEPANAGSPSIGSNLASVASDRATLQDVAAGEHSARSSPLPAAAPCAICDSRHALFPESVTVTTTGEPAAVRRSARVSRRAGARDG